MTGKWQAGGIKNGAGRPVASLILHRYFIWEPGCTKGYGQPAGLPLWGNSSSCGMIKFGRPYTLLGQFGPLLPWWRSGHSLSTWHRQSFRLLQAANGKLFRAATQGLPCRTWGMVQTIHTRTSADVALGPTFDAPKVGSGRPASLTASRQRFMVLQDTTWDSIPPHCYKSATGTFI
jgi:hypothetical protein